MTNTKDDTTIQVSKLEATYANISRTCDFEFGRGTKPFASKMREKTKEKDLPYRDRSFRGSTSEYLLLLDTTKTVYVGNLSFYTTEEQIWELFSQCTLAPKPHAVKRIIMGLNRETRTPCGFCFVDFHTRQQAENAAAWLSGSILDDRVIRVDLDWGFQEGRQFGRGKSGGQVRDEYRMEYDEGRGGFGALVKTSAKAQEEEKEGAAEEGGAEKMQEEAEEGGAEEERNSKRQKTEEVKEEEVKEEEVKEEEEMKEEQAPLSTE